MQLELPLVVEQGVDQDLEKRLYSLQEKLCLGVDLSLQMRLDLNRRIKTLISEIGDQGEEIAQRNLRKLIFA